MLVGARRNPLDPPPFRMSVPSHPVWAQLRAASSQGPIVVAHRGDSRHHPENTLAAFRAASAAGVVMQEFDVRASRDGELVCVHDQGLDRTTDAARVLGPGALVEGLDAATLRRLDAGAWRGNTHQGERIPTLREALACMAAPCVPVVEHKAGSASAYVTTLRESRRLEDCIVQSFDWEFVHEVAQLEPRLALALLGPTAEHQHVDPDVLAETLACGAGMVHWQADLLTAAEVDAAHAAGLLVCTYTTDNELGWYGGQAIGVDAMCTNDPMAMLAWRHRSIGALG